MNSSVFLVCVADFNLGVNTTPKNGRGKALSEACLDRTYLQKIFNKFEKHNEYSVNFFELDI